MRLGKSLMTGARKNCGLRLGKSLRTGGRRGESRRRKLGLAKVSLLGPLH